MTISTTTSRALYAGNGVTTIFSFPYLFLANGDLEVRLIEASGASTVLTLTTDYTVTGANNDAGGSVTMIVAPASGEQLLIRRIVDLTQETAYPSGDPFPAESHERALDKLTMMVQQHDEELARTLQIPPESETDASIINVEAVEVVAAIAADVSAVAVIDADVTTVASNIAAILDAPAQAAAAAASAVAADASAASITLPLPTTSGGTGANYANGVALFTAIKQVASDTDTGVVERLTVTEAQAGLDDSRYHSAATMKAAQIQLRTEVASTSGSAIDFGSIPPWVKEINCFFDGVSANDSSNFLMQLGDAGGIENSGYIGSGVSISDAVSPSVLGSSAGFILFIAGSGRSFSGCVTLRRASTASNKWVASGSLARNDISTNVIVAGIKTLSDTLTTVRFTVTTGAFDLGSVNISYS